LVYNGDHGELAVI